MAVIGKFATSKSGGWEGRICTLSLNLRAKFIPNDDRPADCSPDFYVSTLGCQIGVAWRRDPLGASGKPYLSVQLHDPVLPAPISAALFPSEDGQTANLVWNPVHKGAGNV